MEITYAELTATGPVRENNEDCVGWWQPVARAERHTRGMVVALADGVGGQGQGEVASRVAVDAALNVFQNVSPESSPEEVLTQLFNAANRAVFAKNHDHQGTARLATTLAVAVLRNGLLCAGNVGDSRIYVARAGQIKQISTDHSFVAMQRESGVISAEQAKHSAHRSVLTRSVGLEPVVPVDIEIEPIGKGDRVVLCSDGLYEHITDSEMCEIVMQLSPEEACQKLVQLAEAHGTKDNISVQIIQINEDESVGKDRNVQSSSRTGDYDLRSGEILDGRFLILETITRSGMATIYKATDQAANQPVAIKVPLREFAHDPRFEREEEIGFRIDHPYLLKFIRVENKSRPYIVTEYLRGYTLGHLLHNISPVPVADALQIAGRVCEALHHLHDRGIAHCDLKPQNIMVCYDGTIRLMDFGIAGANARRRILLSMFGAATGTPDYMAPEQVKGRRGDCRTDLYAFGAILYEMLTGRLPFMGESPCVVMNARLCGDPDAPRQVNPQVSPKIEEIILHAMERDPANRYPSALAIKADLAAPDNVIITGRANRLQVPAPLKSRWHFWLRRFSPW